MISSVDRKLDCKCPYTINLDVTFTKQIQKKNKTFVDGHLVVSDSGIQLLDTSLVPICRLDFTSAKQCHRMTLFHKQYDRAVVESQGLLQGVLDGIIVCLDNPPNLPNRAATRPEKIQTHPSSVEKFIPVEFQPATNVHSTKSFCAATRVDQLIEFSSSSAACPPDLSDFRLRIVNTVYREIFNSIGRSTNLTQLMHAKLFRLENKIILESSVKFPDFFSLVVSKSSNQEIMVFRSISGSHPHSARAELVQISSGSCEPITISIMTNLHCDIRLLDCMRSPEIGSSFPFSLLAYPDSVGAIPTPPLSTDIVEDCWDKLMRLCEFTDEQISVLLSVRDWVVSSDSKPLVTIEGVFGSGKSTLIAACMYFLSSVFDCHQLEIDKSRILLLAATNAAVDSTLYKLYRTGYENFVRLGVVDRVDPTLSDFTGTINSSSSRPALTQNEWKNNRRIIGTTAATAADLSLTCQFLFIDEGSQLTEIAALLPLIQTRPIRILVLGDSHQLSQPCAAEISESILTRLAMNKSAKKFELSVQFRCHDSVAQFCSQSFYHRPIVTAKTRAELVDPIPSLLPITIIQHKFRSERESGFKSLLNKNEAQLIIDFLTQRAIPPKISVAVITFYCAQHEYLSDVLAANSLSHIPVHTVDSFQGSEADVILISLVTSDATRSEQFIANPNRLNVALSRAIHKLVIFGHTSLFEKICVFSKLKSLVD